MYLKKLPVAFVLNFRWRINPCKDGLLTFILSEKGLERKQNDKKNDRIQGKHCGRSLGKRATVSNHGKVNSYRSGWNKPETACFCFANGIQMLFCKTREIKLSEKNDCKLVYCVIFCITLYRGCSLTKRYTAKSAKAQRENGTANTRQKNDVDRQSGKPIIFQPSA